jgi:hypothetical protein
MGIFSYDILQFLLDFTVMKIIQFKTSQTGGMSREISLMNQGVCFFLKHGTDVKITEQSLRFEKLS